MTTKKSSVKWNIPGAEKQSAQVDFPSEKLYSDSFEEDSQQLPAEYSDTFLSNSYSDTFAKSSSNGTAINKTSTLINTVLSVKTQSEIPDVTNLETAVTEGMETVLEVDYDDSFTGDSLITTKQDRTLDITESALPDSYSDTFERTKAELSKLTPSEFSESHSASTYTEYSFDDDSLLDHSYIAPDFNGKSLAEDEDVTSLDDEYSLTFEPTETSCVPLDTEKARLEAEQANIGEMAKKEFLKKMMTQLTARGERKVKQLETIPGDREDAEENDYLRYFCKKKMKLLRKKKEKNHELDNHKTMEESTGPPAKLLSDYGLSDSVLEHAKLTNIMSAMKRAANEEIHVPSKCAQCREMKSALDFEDAQRQFVSLHAKRLKNRTMDARVEEHILKMNSVSLIAELARDLPSSSEKPEKIFDRLFEPLLGKNVMR